MDADNRETACWENIAEEMINPSTHIIGVCLFVWCLMAHQHKRLLGEDKISQERVNTENKNVI